MPPFHGRNTTLRTSWSGVRLLSVARSVQRTTDANMMLSHRGLNCVGSSCHRSKMERGASTSSGWGSSPLGGASAHLERTPLVRGGTATHNRPGRGSIPLDGARLPEVRRGHATTSSRMRFESSRRQTDLFSRLRVFLVGPLGTGGGAKLARFDPSRETTVPHNRSGEVRFLSATMRRNFSLGVAQQQSR